MAIKMPEIKIPKLSFLRGKDLVGVDIGTDSIKLEKLVKSQEFDYVITGHTHHKEIKHEGKTILINPGETFGDLYGEATVAILETETNNVVFYDL